MKHIGFLKEYDSLPFSSEMKDVLSDEKQDNGLIIKYLEKGVSCMGWMSYFADDEDEDKLIAPFEYFTDGEWIWTSYFSYFLKKYSNYKVSEDFIEYVSKNFDKDINLSEERLLEIENNLVKEFQ